MSHQIIVAIWSAVLATYIAQAVLGILTEPDEIEVFDSNPDILREQLQTWSNEFFSTSKFRGRLSRLEEITPSTTTTDSSYSSRGDSSYLHNENHEQEEPHYSSRDVHGRSNIFRSRMQSTPTGPTTSNSNSDDDFIRQSARLNARYHDISRNIEGGRPIVKEENLEWMLQNIFMYPRNHNTNETAKEIARKYIIDSFQVTSGLHTIVQHFQPLQFMSMYEGQQVPMGSNIIGVIKGREWGTRNDHITLVGAHYDTVNFTPGTDDNGSGVSAMLEIARAISAVCKPKYSIIFIAFDLEEVGSQGSLVFIKDYLMQVLKANFPDEMISSSRFQGAYILDTIMNFNDTDNSQMFPTEWSLVLPEVYDKIADNGHRGDFISMIYRRDVDKKMAAKFQYHWDKSSMDSRYKLTSFPLGLTAELPPMEILADHLNFLRSDHSRFWYMNDTSVPFTLNAVLMTDTGPYRGTMQKCYHSVCDQASLFSNPRSLKFLQKISQVLAETLADMSMCQYEGDNNGRSNYRDSNFIRTNRVHARSSAFRHGSPLKNLINFVRWMHSTTTR